MPPEFIGIERFEARKKIISRMEEHGLLSLVEETTHVVPHGDRSQVPLEPWLTDQWYCNAEVLAQEPIKAVQDLSLIHI